MLNFQTEAVQEQMIAIFGDDPIDDEDGKDKDEELSKIPEILRYFHMPTLLSPIRDAQLNDSNAEDAAISIVEKVPEKPQMNDEISLESFVDVTEKVGETTVIKHSESESQTADDRESDSELRPIDTNVDFEVQTLPTIAVDLEPNLSMDNLENLENVENLENSASQTTECAIIELDNNFDDSPASPASPQPEGDLFTEPLKAIPLYTQTSNEYIDEDGTASNNVNDSVSALDRMIYGYSGQAGHENTTFVKPLTNDECYLLASIRNAMETHCLKSTPAPVCVNRMLSITRRPIWLATAILELVEDARETISVEFTPPAPAMQPSLQKLLVVTESLNRYIDGFDRFVEFELERRLFSLVKDEHVLNLINLTQFYTGLIDIERPQNKAKVRMFIYKCLYYFSHKAVPLVFTMVMAHPHVLPHANSIEFIGDPLVRAITSILSNIQYTSMKENELPFRKKEMYMTLKRRFGYFADKSFPIDCAIDYCIDQIKQNRLKNVSYALILLAKRQGPEYAIKEIAEKRLIPMLQQYFTGNLSSIHEYDQQIVVILSTIGSIVKTLPAHENIDGFADIFVRCLNASERQVIQEAAVSALCQMNRFGTAKIYHHLKLWTPKYQISSRIDAMLRTIVHRKPKYFWLKPT